MKKLFEAEYGSGLAEQIEKWVRSQTITEDGGCRVFRPYAVVELFDQNGNPIINNPK